MSSILSTPIKENPGTSCQMLNETNFSPSGLSIHESSTLSEEVQEGTQSDNTADLVDIMSVVPAKEKETQHTNPNWLNNLKENFTEVIIAPCSVKTRNAVRDNSNFATLRDHKYVKDEILNSLVSHLKTLFTVDNLPNMPSMREICYKLSNKYPAMFQEGDGNEDVTRKAFAPDKIDILASKLKERLRGQLRTEKKRGISNEIDNESKKLKGKIKIIYGVDMEKWKRKTKASAAAIAELKSANTVMDCNQRESVYEKFRNELTELFNSGKSISAICKGFWISDVHIANQFSYLCSSSSLNSNVSSSLGVQFDHLERFLVDQCKSMEFQEKMEEVENSCHVNKNGSKTLKYIHLLVR